MSTIIGYIVMTETVLVTSDDGTTDTYFKVNYQFPYYEKTWAEISCGCGTDATYYAWHYQVTVDDIDYYIPDIYSVEVSENEGIDDRTKTEREIEESKMSQIDDFGKLAKKYLDIDKKRSYAPDYESDGVIETKLNVNPGS